MTLASKIAAASKAVGGKLKADARNTEQNYDYLSADLILSICGQALAEQGVVIWPSIEATDVQTIDRGNSKYRYDAMLRLAMTLADGETEQRCDWIGLGTDYMTPDKAVYKAITSGHKYFIMKLFNVGALNEDGEHEPGEEGGGKPVARQTASKPPVATGPVPNCPKCGGAMWDNRERKTNPKAPDFKCKNKECDGAIWPPKDNGNGNGATGEAVNADSKATQPQIAKIHTVCGKLYKTPEQIAAYRSWLKENYGVESSKDLTVAQASAVIEVLSAEEAKAMAA